MFVCDQCGHCCRNLDKSLLYQSLHNGDGKCQYLQGNCCSIYEKRPLLCRIDDSYDHYFAGQMSREAYDALNYQSCQLLKKTKGDI